MSKSNEKNILMKDNQLLIVDAQSFTNKKGSQTCILQCVHYDNFGNLKAEHLFCSQEAVDGFMGPGVYDASVSFGGSVTGIEIDYEVTF